MAKKRKPPKGEVVPPKRFVGLRRAIFEAVMAGESRTRAQRMLIRWVGAAIAGFEIFVMALIYLLFGAAFDLLNAFLNWIGWNPFEPFLVYIMRISGALVFGLKVFFGVYEEWLLLKRERNELEKGV